MKNYWLRPFLTLLLLLNLEELEGEKSIGRFIKIKRQEKLWFELLNMAK
jgi:hypothetical protein